METSIIDDFLIPIEDYDSLFHQGLPDYIGKGYVGPSDHFWQTEIEYNGFKKNIDYEKNNLEIPN